MTAYDDVNQAPGAQHAVLIVEDEPLLLLFAVTLVEDAGFQAVTASNADEAIAILIARTDIRVVFTDIDMPGSMNGLKLAAAVRNRWPPIDIIMVSGKLVPHVNEMPDRACFFSKPYDARHIAAALNRMAA